MAFRAHLQFGGGPQHDEIEKNPAVYRELVELLAANKFNHVMFEVGEFATEKDLREFGEFCRLNFVEPLPHHPFLYMSRKIGSMSDRSSRLAACKPRGSDREVRPDTGRGDLSVCKVWPYVSAASETHYLSRRPLFGLSDCVEQDAGEKEHSSNFADRDNDWVFRGCGIDGD